MARQSDHKRISPKAVATAGITGATAVLAAPAAFAQEASTQYPNYGAWASAGLQWEWFYVIIAVLAIVSLIVTIVLSGKTSRRNGRREGGI